MTDIVERLRSSAVEVDRKEAADEIERLRKEAALTAAAEVAPHPDCGDPGCCPDNPAAAGVGEQTELERLRIEVANLRKEKTPGYELLACEIERLENKLETITAATIERCAQMAERELQAHPISGAEIERINKIAAAIRKVKEGK